MPFKSKKQETYLKINEPKVYKKWKRDYDKGGVNLQIPGGNLNMTESDVTATMQDGPTWAQLNKRFKGDASALIEQEVYVDKNKRVYLNMWDKEGAGGAGIGITATGENWNVNATRTKDDTSISGNFVKRFNKGGMNGCPMDGAIMKGGTKIKPDRYKNGKKEV